MRTAHTYAVHVRNLYYNSEKRNFVRKDRFRKGI